MYQDTAKDLSERIAQRREYGYREEVAMHRGRVIMWSNAQANWLVTRRIFKTGDVLKLDSNQVLAYGSTDHLQRIVNKLDELPLYGNSFEATHGRHR